MFYNEKLRNSTIFPIFFESSDQQNIPIELDGYDYFRLDREEGYKALLHKLLGQPLHQQPEIGTKPDLGSIAIPPLFSRPSEVTEASTITDINLPKGSELLLGREEELALLDAAWEEGSGLQLVELIAPGGVGKTSLIKRWLDQMRADGWRGARRVYGWSFYNQGSNDDGQTSEELFLSKALEWFGVEVEGSLSPHDKGRKLAGACRGGDDSESGKMGKWENAARGYGNLSELQLTLGHVAHALDDVVRSVRIRETRENCPCYAGQT